MSFSFYCVMWVVATLENIRKIEIKISYAAKGVNNLQYNSWHSCKGRDYNRARKTRFECT